MVVTLAAVILGLMALLSLLSAVVGLVGLGETTEEFRRLAATEPFDPDEIEAVVGFLRASFICNAVVSALFAILLAVLAWGVARGSQAARVITWIVCGVGLLCACCNGSGALASFSTLSPSSTDPDQIAGNLAVRSLPAWVAGILLGSSVLSVLGYIATAILLALPTATAYFKGRPPAGWAPPQYPQNPPPHYPQTPSHPSHPAPPSPPSPTNPTYQAPPPPPPPPSDQ